MALVYSRVGIIGNPNADRGRGAAIGAQTAAMLRRLGRRHGFDVCDMTGDSYEASLDNARHRLGSCDALIVVGGDGMVNLGINAVGFHPVPLGVVATGSGNDFARGLRLPVDHPAESVHGIVAGLIRGTSLEVDLGRVRFRPRDDGMTKAHSALRSAWQSAMASASLLSALSPLSLLHGEIRSDRRRTARLQEKSLQEKSSRSGGRYFAGMLSCGIDASVNDRANHSTLPNGSLRYVTAVAHELMHIQEYGYHVNLELPDGRVEERDIVTPLLTVANSRYIGGGIALSPYSRLDDGLLDLIWVKHMPSAAQCLRAVALAYRGRTMESALFGWQRVRSIRIAAAGIAARPPMLMMDGEYAGTVPVEVQAIHRELRLLVPPAAAR